MNMQSQNRPLGSRSWVFNIAVLISLGAVLTAIQTFLIDPTARRFGTGQADLHIANYVLWAVTVLMLFWAWQRLFKR
jgi:hypothetical protein